MTTVAFIAGSSAMRRNQQKGFNNETYSILFGGRFGGICHGGQ